MTEPAPYETYGYEESRDYKDRTVTIRRKVPGGYIYVVMDFWDDREGHTHEKEIARTFVKEDHDDD